MKRIVSLLLTLVMIFGVLTTLVSCGAPKNDGAEISIYLGSQIFDFDPSDYYVSANAEMVLSLLYEPLFKINKNGKLKNAAAKDYEVDKEERKIIINLRDSYWSDNVKVTASDFVYAWCNRIISSANANPAAALFYDIEGVKEAMNGQISIYDVAIKATEMDQITITYCEGADYKRILNNLASVATAPVRESAVDSAEGYWSKTSNSILTNGAFELKSYNKDTGEFELARNVGYHQKPTVKDYDNKVKASMFYGTFADATFLNESGEVVNYLNFSDLKGKVTFIMAEAPLSERAEYEKKAKTADQTSVYTYVFNTEHPLFSDANVRLALSTAIDRDAIIDAITFGKAADGFIPDVSGGAKKDFISSGSNIDKAKEYLAQAKDQDVVRAYQTKGFTLKIDSDEQSKKIAELVVANWKDLGFEVTIEVVPTAETEFADTNNVIYDSGIQRLVQDVAYQGAKTVDEAGNVTYKYDVMAIDWQTYSLDAGAGLASLTSNANGIGKNQFTGEPGVSADYSEARKNIAAWSDATYDALVAEALACNGKKDRAEKLAKAEEYLMGQMPVCPLVFNQSFVFTSSKISKLKFDGLGHFELAEVKLGNYKKYYKPEETEE